MTGAGQVDTLAIGADGCLDPRAPFGTEAVAGDVVKGPDQISVAMGHGVIAATRAHNWLRERDHETLQNA